MLFPSAGGHIMSAESMKKLVNVFFATTLLPLPIALLIGLFV
jgi:hypothetical protein